MPRILSAASTLLALACLAACAAPADLDLSLTRPTIEHRYVVALQPPATPAAINQMHSWLVRVHTPAGTPIHGARIAVDGGMPQHGHGLPTTPRVTRELADGTYVIDGMKFSMTGWWEIKLAIDAADGADKVTFNTVVASSTAAGR